MFTHQHRVAWSDVDLAGIVYFPRFLDYCHAALEELFDALPERYAGLTGKRRIGIPTVHASIDYRAPLPFGDTALVHVSVEKLGRSSVHLRYEIVRASDQTLSASVQHIVVCSHLDTLRSTELPDDVRALLSKHLIEQTP